jgi:hypothetical protein
MTIPNDTCAGGTNIDRFVSISVNERDSRRNFEDENAGSVIAQRADDPDFESFTSASWPVYGNFPAKNESYGPFDGYGPVNKYYQYVKDMGMSEKGNLREAKVVTAAEALVDPTKDPDGAPRVAFPAGSGNSSRIIWQNGDPADAESNLGNVKEGYGVHRHNLAYNYDRPTGTAERAWGPQTWPDHRWRYASSWGGNFQRMPLIYNHLNIHTREHAGDWGYFANAPFDTHFIGALIAPRPLVITQGLIDNNGGSETAFFGFLAVREVYRFLGKEDNIGFYLAVHEHSQPESNWFEAAKAFRAILDEDIMDASLRPNSVEEYPYPINDPRSRYDYVKLDWAAPGYESIADQVEKLVPANATSWDQIGGIPD